LTPRTDKLTGIILIISALQVLPVSDTMAKFLSVSLPIIQVIWARFFFHCIITGTYTFLKHDRRLLLPNISWALTARSAALFSAVSLFYITIHYLPLTTTLTLWFVEPFILTILAMIFFKERVNSFQWMSIVLGFIGIFIAIRPTPTGWHWAYIVGLLAGVSYALFLLLTSAVDSRTPPIASVYQTGLIGCIASTLIVVPSWTPPTPVEWFYLAAIGLVAACAHFLIIKSFELADASTLAPFTYSEVIAATILGFLVFGDAPDLWTYIGLSIIIASAIGLLIVKQPDKAPSHA
jgi:drug/metabolite transporter (DMT)-like permease